MYTPVHTTLPHRPFFLRPSVGFSVRDDIGLGCQVSFFPVYVDLEVSLFPLWTQAPPGTDKRVIHWNRCVGEWKPPLCHGCTDGPRIHSHSVSSTHLTVGGSSLRRPKTRGKDGRCLHSVSTLSSRPGCTLCVTSPTSE